MDETKWDGLLNGKGGLKMKIEDIKKAMLLQTNSMTFGQFEVTAIQDNIITLINEQLQKYMSKEIELNRDLFGMPYVLITCDEAGGLRHKDLVKKHIEELAKKIFRFRWTLPGRGEMQTSGTIICALHDFVGSNQVGITLNPWAIPFLTYYGKGVGGTWYKKQIALSLRGDKAKRIYKILCSKCTYNGGVYDYSIEQFRNDFMLGPSYTNTIIKNRILETAKNEINGICADVWFEYKLITKYPKNNKRKPMADTIRFYIHTQRKGQENHRLSSKGHPGKDFIMYRWLISTFGTTQQTENIFNTIMQSDRRDEVIDRFVFWNVQVTKGEKTSQHVKNCIKGLVRDDFNIDVAKERKDKKITRGFVPPTLEEVKAYFKERGTDIDPELFWSHYETSGWMTTQGKPIKQWKERLAVWENNKKNIT